MIDDETLAAIERLRDRIPDRWGKWIDCEEGWWRLLARLDADLVAIKPDWVCKQVKTKFGDLCVYFDETSMTDDEYRRFRERIREAEREAEQTCEVCGQPGSPAHPGNRMSWRIVCDEHLPAGTRTWVRVEASDE